MIVAVESVNFETKRLMINATTTKMTEIFILYIWDAKEKERKNNISFHLSTHLETQALQSVHGIDQEMLNNTDYLQVFWYLKPSHWEHKHLS